MGWSSQQMFDNKMFEPLDIELWSQCKDSFVNYKSRLDTFINKLPTHYEYLSNNIYKT